MTTSGQTGATPTIGNLLYDVAMTLKAMPSEGSTMPAVMQQNFLRQLNAMVAAWRKQGMHLWKTEEVTLFPETGKKRYELSPTGDHATLSGWQTELTADAALGASVIDVGDASGINDGDYIGLILADQTTFWTTVMGAPAGNVVTLDAPLTGAALDAGAVFAYADKIPVPVTIVSARRHNIQSTYEVTIDKLSRSDYDDRPNKNIQGDQIFEYYFDKQRDTSFLSVNQVPRRVYDVLKLTAQLPVEDSVFTIDSPDLPTEWYLALQFNLAAIMMPRYNVPGARARDIQNFAGIYLQTVVGDDREDVSVQFAPDLTGR